MDTVCDFYWLRHLHDHFFFWCLVSAVNEAHFQCYRKLFFLALWMKDRPRSTKFSWHNSSLFNRIGSGLRIRRHDRCLPALRPEYQPASQREGWSLVDPIPNLCYGSTYFFFQGDYSSILRKNYISVFVVGVCYSSWPHIIYTQNTRLSSLVTCELRLAGLLYFLHHKLLGPLLFQHHYTEYLV